MDFPTPVTISSSPKILVFKNVLSKERAENFMESNKDMLLPSKVTDGNIISSSQKRTSSSTFIKNDSFLDSLKLSICKNFDIEDSEGFQYVRYIAGQKYDAHYDAFDTNEIKKNSVNKQRVITNIIYLNDGFNGGDTFFPHLDISITPLTGTMISFEDCINGTLSLNPFSLHESKKIISGEKHILTLWLLADIS